VLPVAVQIWTTLRSHRSVSDAMRWSVYINCCGQFLDHDRDYRLAQSPGPGYSPRVEWSSLAGTALGALIGVSATLSAERTRWRRGRRDSDKVVKRQTYADYLAALSRARNEVRSAAFSGSVPLADRSRRAADAFKTGETYELRYQVALLGPDSAVSASDSEFRALRGLRDLVEAGTLHRDDNYLHQRSVWDPAFNELMQRMKDDLLVS
jgi:hypothetical protein